MGRGYVGSVNHSSILGFAAPVFLRAVSSLESRCGAVLFVCEAVLSRPGNNTARVSTVIRLDAVLRNVCVGLFRGRFVDSTTPPRGGVHPSSQSIRPNQYAYQPKTKTIALYVFWQVFQAPKIRHPKDVISVRLETGRL